MLVYSRPYLLLQQLERTRYSVRRDSKIRGSWTLVGHGMILPPRLRAIRGISHRSVGVKVPSPAFRLCNHALTVAPAAPAAVPSSEQLFGHNRYVVAAQRKAY